MRIRAAIRRPLVVVVSVVSLVAVGCGDETSEGGGEGGDALGGSARTTDLASTIVDDLPDPPLAWVGFEREGSARHTHDRAFVYARNARVSLELDGEERTIAAGEAAFVPAETEHAHGGGTVWEILLAPPGTQLDGADRIFESPSLEGLSEARTQLSFLLVELPPDAVTSVHAHPGPEYIYVTESSLVYQNAIDGILDLGVDDGHYVPPGTAVQKRNPDGPTAAFLSWFAVPPEEPFAPGASFEEG